MKDKDDIKDIRSWLFTTGGMLDRLGGSKFTCSEKCVCELIKERK